MIIDISNYGWSSLLVGAFEEAFIGAPVFAALGLWKGLAVVFAVHYDEASSIDYFLLKNVSAGFGNEH